MTHDLETFLSANYAHDPYRVEQTLKSDDSGTTQLVYLVLADGSELGPFIRKQFYVEPGVGRAYELLRQAQDEGFRCTALPRVISCRVDENIESVLLEYIVGDTLFDMVSRDGGSFELACKIFPLLCRAVDVLRTNFNPPLIHRDIKPSNVMISNDIPVLIDFGIARQFCPDALQDTVKFGTRGYAAPEQYGFGQTDIQTDVYALGMVLYFCVTGQDAVGALSDAQIEACNMPHTCKDVLRRATAFDPAARFPSALDFEHAWTGAVESASSMSSDELDAHDRLSALGQFWAGIGHHKKKASIRTNVLLMFWLIMLLFTLGIAFDPVAADAAVPLWFRLLEYPVMIMCFLTGLMYPFLDKGFVFKMIPPLGRMSKPKRFICVSAIAILPVFIVSIIGMMAGII